MSNEQNVIKLLKEANNYKYSWDKAIGGDDPKKTKLDRLYLNRGEGYEIAPFITHLLENNNWKISPKNVRILEKNIHEDCVKETRQKTKEIEECIISLHQ